MPRPAEWMTIVPAAAGPLAADGKPRRPSRRFSDVVFAPDVQKGANA
jgi:hypothetical protein